MLCLLLLENKVTTTTTDISNNITHSFKYHCTIAVSDANLNDKSACHLKTATRACSQCHVSVFFSQQELHQQPLTESASVQQLCAVKPSSCSDVTPDSSLSPTAAASPLPCASSPSPSLPLSPSYDISLTTVGSSLITQFDSLFHTLSDRGTERDKDRDTGSDKGTYRGVSKKNSTGLPVECVELVDPPLDSLTVTVAQCVEEHDTPDYRTVAPPPITPCLAGELILCVVQPTDLNALTETEVDSVCICYCENKMKKSDKNSLKQKTLKEKRIQNSGAEKELDEHQCLTEGNEVERSHLGDVLMTLAKDLIESKASPKSLELTAVANKPSISIHSKSMMVRLLEADSVSSNEPHAAGVSQIMTSKKRKQSLTNSVFGTTRQKKYASILESEKGQTRVKNALESNDNVSKFDTARSFSCQDELLFDKTSPSRSRHDHLCCSKDQPCGSNQSPLRKHIMQDKPCYSYISYQTVFQIKQLFLFVKRFTICYNRVLHVCKPT